jgi:citrate synthase
VKPTKKAVWHSGITRIQPNKVAVRGYDIAELMGRVSFGAAVYLILTGELPSPAVARLMDAILVSSIDHGATPPSALSARTVASTGATLSASVAAGVMSINRHHGGAIEDCARQLKAFADRAARDSISLEEAATRTLRTMSEAGERMSGFGHRVHSKDPRTVRLVRTCAARPAWTACTCRRRARSRKHLPTRKNYSHQCRTVRSAPFSPTWE